MIPQRAEDAPLFALSCGKGRLVAARCARGVSVWREHSSAQGSLFLQGEQNVLLAHLGGKLGELTDLENNATTIWGGSSQLHKISNTGGL